MGQKKILWYNWIELKVRGFLGYWAKRDEQLEKEKTLFFFQEDSVQIACSPSHHVGGTKVKIVTLNESKRESWIYILTLCFQVLID